MSAPAGARAAGSAAPSPRPPAAPGNLLADTVRREQALVRMALGRAAPAGPAAQGAPSKVSPETHKRVEKFYGVAVPSAAGWLDVFASGANIRVSLQLEETTVRDALKQVFDQAKLSYVVDEDVPHETRVTAKAENVRLHTALNLITEAAGVRWTVEQKVTERAATPHGQPLRSVSAAATSTYRIGKLVGRVAPATGILLQRDGTLTAPALRYSESVIPYTVSGREERSTFTCPHCKAQSTLVRVKNQPKCPKCERTYQPDWQFCPADGTKRPTPPVDWKFCPSCGKQVKPEKATESGDPLESLPPPPPTLPEAARAPAPDPTPTGAIPTEPETYQP